MTNKSTRLNLLQKLFFLTLGFCFSMSIFISANYVQAQNIPTITGIRVEGVQRIEADTVRAYLGFQVGDPVDLRLIDEGLKSLYATGFFADVQILREGNGIVIKVRENPIINRVAFEGNRRIDDKTLTAEVQLRPRVVYSATKAIADAKRIQDIYRRNGRFATTVEPKIIQLEQNRVDLVFEIKEGTRTTVASVLFVGNKIFSDRTLRSQIITHRSAWYRFLSTNDNYDPDRIEADIELLKNYYGQQGYVDFNVLSNVVEFSPERNAFFVTFTLEEGNRYKIGTVNLTTNLRNLNVDRLKKLIRSKAGSWFDSSLVEETISDLTEEIGTLGYAFAGVEPALNIDRENRRVDITYQIKEGIKVYVERIDIVGNVRTLDRVIRREFQIAEGDAFNASKLRTTRQRLFNLGFFSKVDIQTKQGSAPDKVVLVVDVQEQSTGSLNFGLGYSTSDGPVGTVTLSEQNFLGKGQALSVNLTLSGLRSSAQISFDEPYFMGRDLRAGFDIFRTQAGLFKIGSVDEQSYRETSTGFTLRAGYDLSEHLSQNWSYLLSYDQIFKVKNGVSEAVQQQKGNSIKSSLSHSLVLDYRDSRFDTREGYSIRVSNEFAGLGGDISYLKSRVSAGYWVPVFNKNVTLALTGEAGYIFGIGQKIRIVDSFYLGGDNLRGFEAAGIGPRDLLTDDALGGNISLKGTVELSFPLGLPEEYQIRGRIFTDFGTVFRSDFKAASVVDDTKLRVSVGFGFTWRSPFGPLAVDFGFPLMKAKYDVKQVFRFSVGTRF